MIIKKKIGQHRRDFRAIYLCQFCDHEVTASGYDDTHFHENVIPHMKCSNCGVRTVDQDDGNRSAPRHDDGVVI